MAIEYACIVPHPPLIVPAVGKGEENKITATVEAYIQIAQEIACIKPETIVVASPHSVMYGDYIHISLGKSAQGAFDRFGAPQARFEKTYDTEFVSTLSDIAFDKQIHAGTLGERDPELDHGTMVPLHYIDQYYQDYQLVRVSISGLSFLEHYRFGMCVAEAAQKLGRKTVFVASGDLSHKLLDSGPYGFAAEGPAFDEQVTQAMREGDFGRFFDFDEVFAEAAAECGLRSFIEMAGALDGLSVKPTAFSYEGPFGVGYGVCGYEIGSADESRHFGEVFEQKQAAKLAVTKSHEDEYVKLARLSLETYVKTGKRAKLPEGLSDDMLNRRAGVFVSLKKNGRLRGCIGTIEPTAPSIAEEILRNAVSAGTGDPRFDVVTEDELNSLVYSVDVLGEAEPALSMDDLDAKRYGVIVTKGHKRGLLLPNLEGVNTPQEQVNIALQKAGIPRNDKYTMERFEVVRHK
jgi:AmmeMemoRadiSam system protein A/AmmeMemoRadiSam system protein B